MIDLHMHTLMSDGVLIPSELIRRARVAGYDGMAITDHADESNVEQLISQLSAVCSEYSGKSGIKVLYGVELTHVSPSRIPRLVERARKLGAQIIIGHGETLSEPVEPGTNGAYIKARVDILAHPGLIGSDECALAAKNNVMLEITSRAGHSLSNGHVALMARKHKAKLVLNTDTHSPGDLITDAQAGRVAAGAGITKEEFRRIRENAKKILKKTAA